MGMKEEMERDAADDDDDGFDDRVEVVLKMRR